MFTFTNILPAEERALLGVQYTDIDFLSRENSKVNSFFISCLITYNKIKQQYETILYLKESYCKLHF